MRVLIFAEAESVARAAADLVARCAAERPELVLALPTGKTAIPLYAELAAAHAGGSLDLSRARSFNLDELRLPRRHPATFRAFMERHAWERIGLDRARCDIPDAEAEPAAECARYDLALAAAGPLDLAILGVGADGHVGYNLPGVPSEGTHLVDLPEALADSLGAPADWRPLQAITLGFGPLRGARRLLMLATTAAKARAVRHLVVGPSDPAWPCSLLRDHPNFDLLLTHEAATELD